MKTLTLKECQDIKDRFEKHVDRRSRKDMIDFLLCHFRYDTMDSWNMTSYAHCIKLHRSNLPEDIFGTMYNMVYAAEWRDRLCDILGLFSHSLDGNWQAAIKGRSGGYIVLCEGVDRDGPKGCITGRSIDRGEDFHEWDVDRLRARVDLVCEFDVLTSSIVTEFISFCRMYDIVDEVIMVPKTIQVLREKQ